MAPKKHEDDGVTDEDRRAAARLLIEDRIADVEKHAKKEKEMKKKGGENK